MDSHSKYKEDTLASQNLPPTATQGSYFEDFSASYKGFGKGLIGGTLIGMGMGLLMGVAAAGALALALPGIFSFGSVVAGFTAFGTIKGMVEFSHIGMIAGATSSANEKSDRRLHAHLDEMQEDIDEIKAVIKGSTPETEKRTHHNHGVEVEYRSSHCDNHCPSLKKPVFWKVAAIGALVGAAAGAVLGVAGMSDLMLHYFTHDAATLASLSTGQAMAATAISAGAVGASFGMNRDYFRQALDVTDQMYSGRVVPQKQKGEDKAPARAQEPEKCNEVSAKTTTYQPIPHTPSARQEIFIRNLVAGKTVMTHGERISQEMLAKALEDPDLGRSVPN